MSLYRPAKVSEQPSQQLEQWSVRRVDKFGQPTDHFCGVVENGDGRVSSPIQNFDDETGIGVTRSGRRYELIGDSGLSLNAEYIWGAWCRLNGVKNKDDFEDVSASYQQKKGVVK